MFFIKDNNINLSDLSIFNGDETNSIRVDWEQFKHVLTNNNISYFYHVTDSSNIDSIKSNGGLFSWEYCNANKIYISAPGGNQRSREFDSEKGLSNYVRLFLNPEQPMIFLARCEKRINNPVKLKIDPRIVYLSSTLFSNINATDKNAEIGGTIDFFQKISFNTVNFRPLDGSERKLLQAEILVKTNIPTKFITNIDHYNAIN
jgi:hypothetical protein